MSTLQSDADMIDEAIVVLLRELWNSKRRHGDTPEIDDLRFSLELLTSSVQVKGALKTYVAFRNARVNYKLNGIDYCKLASAIDILALWLQSDNEEPDQNVLLMSRMAISLCKVYTLRKLDRQSCPSHVDVHPAGSDTEEENKIEAAEMAKNVIERGKEGEIELTLCTDEYKESLSGLLLCEIKLTHKRELKGAKIEILSGTRANKVGILVRWSGTVVHILFEGDVKYSSVNIETRVRILDWNK